MKKSLSEGNFASYLNDYFEGIDTLLFRLDKKEIEKTVSQLLKIKTEKGRLFLLGVGGSAANCSHAVNDLRKICHIESYTPSDNVSELTARINDDGWENCFADWLKVNNISKKDCIIVFSVGGGNKKTNTSVNIVKALEYARHQKTPIIAIVSRDGGYTKQVADICIQIPVAKYTFITPFAETFQLLIWHAIVNYPPLGK